MWPKSKTLQQQQKKETEVITVKKICILSVCYLMYQYISSIASQPMLPDKLNVTLILRGKVIKNDIIFAWCM